jgi:hypothetical protein
MAAALAASMLAQGALAQFTGNIMLSMMQSPAQKDNAAAFMFVMGFNEGAAATEAQSISERGSSGPKMFCVPPGATNQQQYDIVKSYLVEHASMRHFSAGVLTGLALQAAWPCAH